jgi:hypothetical protein
MAQKSPIRWYNPKLGLYEWREVPQTDEQALELLEDSPYSRTCTQTYCEWRALGATITAALIRAGEATNDEREGREDERGRGAL